MKENYDFSQGKRGAVIPISSQQTKLNILIDNDILEWFGNQVEEMEGGDYLTLINEALRDYIKQKNIQQKQELSRLG
jgi:uncharacterized protein (DUF4415 family)